MKISELLALSFLLFAFPTLSLPGAGAMDTGKTPVLDIFGNSLTTDHEYYVYGSPYDNGTNLEVTLASESTCPRRLKLSAISFKQRVAISAVDTANDSVIRIDTKLNFQFNFSIAHVSCDSSTKWMVSFNESLNEWFVTIGGHNFHDWFKIEKYKDTNNYQLFYCPKPEPGCLCNCVEVGTVLEDGVPYLAPNGDPFPVVFGQAENAQNVPQE